MKTTEKIAKLNKSIELQNRTLKNLEAIKLSDNGETITLTKQIIMQLEANKKNLERQIIAE